MDIKINLCNAGEKQRVWYTYFGELKTLTWKLFEILDSGLNAKQEDDNIIAHGD